LGPFQRWLVGSAVAALGAVWAVVFCCPVFGVVVFSGFAELPILEEKKRIRSTSVAVFAQATSCARSSFSLDARMITDRL
jgi:hypothetical protein